MASDAINWGEITEKGSCLYVELKWFIGLYNDPNDTKTEATTTVTLRQAPLSFE